MKTSAAFFFVLSLFLVGCGSSDPKTSPETQAQIESITGHWLSACDKSLPGRSELVSVEITRERRFLTESRYFTTTDCTGAPEYDTFKSGTYSFITLGQTSTLRLDHIEEWSVDDSRKNVNSQLVDVTVEVATPERDQLTYQITGGTRVYSDGDSTAYGRGAFGTSELLFRQ
jgi:hypothetical protein